MLSAVKGLSRYHTEESRRAYLPERSHRTDISRLVIEGHGQRHVRPLVAIVLG
ncbi:hypothetical protein AB0877_05600 [Micromonospora sp. NPDC047644]|uniref:hypothetical protein n=1 Tax=Micromonospora sp. NPDC047644 TaxID=3157203 RepID=UPI003456F5D7